MKMAMLKRFTSDQADSAAGLAEAAEAEILGRIGAFRVR